MRLVVRIADEPFVVVINAPARWEERRAEDVVHLVIKKAAEIRESRGRNPPKWLPSRVAEVAMRCNGEPVDRLAPVHACREMTLWPREWRCRSFDVVPGDALREAFAYAGGTLDAYRVVSRRFRDEANAVVRTVRLPPHFAHFSASSFRNAEVVHAGSVERGLARSLPLFSRIRALDLSCAVADDLPSLWPRLPSTLRSLDVSFFFKFCDADLCAVAESCPSLTALDVTGTRVSSSLLPESFPFLTHVAADAAVAASFLLKSKNIIVETFAATTRSASDDDDDDDKGTTDSLVSQLTTTTNENMLLLLLTSLRLARCGQGLRDDHLLALRQLSALTDLDLSFSAISDLGIALLFAARPTLHVLTKPPAPTALSLRGCDAITDASLAVLAEPGSGGSRLRILDLELLWRLTAGAIINLANASSSSSLRRIFVRGAASVNRKLIRDQHFAHLAVVFAPRFPTKGTADFLRSAPAPLRHRASSSSQQQQGIGVESAASSSSPAGGASFPAAAEDEGSSVRGGSSSSVPPS